MGGWVGGEEEGKAGLNELLGGRGKGGGRRTLLALVETFAPRPFTAPAPVPLTQIPRRTVPEDAGAHPVLFGWVGGWVDKLFLMG